MRPGNKVKPREKFVLLPTKLPQVTCHQTLFPICSQVACHQNSFPVCSQAICQLEQDGEETHAGGVGDQSRHFEAR